jgi:hypothetical protein
LSNTSRHLLRAQKKKITIRNRQKKLSHKKKSRVLDRVSVDV